MRISWLASSVVVFVLAVPTAAAPGPVFDTLVHFSSNQDDGDGVFDPTGASGYDGLQAPDGVTVRGVPVFLQICHSHFECEFLELSLTWTVGPRISYEPFDDWPDAPEGSGVYTYGAGTLTVDGHWDSHDEPGIFVADIGSVVIELTFECSFGLCGTTDIGLGNGLFHESLAHLLRVSKNTQGGSYLMGTDGASFFGDFGYGLGDGYSNLEIFASVPEPASILVTALGLLGVAARRRRARVTGSRAN